MLPTRRIRRKLDSGSKWCGGRDLNLKIIDKVSMEHDDT